jgi:hypothetical protein
MYPHAGVFSCALRILPTKLRQLKPRKIYLLNKRVLVCYLTCMSSPAIPVQPKLFVPLSSTNFASYLISNLVNCGFGAQTFKQLLHTTRTVMTALAEQAYMLRVYEMKLCHWHPSGSK